MKRTVFAFVFFLSALSAAIPATAQFTGPSASGRPSTVAEARDVRLGSYVTLTGHIVNHQRSDYFTFRDDTGEIRVETADRATGYFTTRSDRDAALNARTAGVYLRADPSDLQVLNGGSEEDRAQLIARRLREWKSVANGS